MKKNKQNDNVMKIHKIVVSETKNKYDDVCKRQVIEQWEYKDGKKDSFTFHEKLTKQGWVRKKQKNNESHLHNTNIIV